MDAAHTFSKYTVLFLVAALLIAVPATAQQLVANPNQVNLTTSQQSVTVTVTASDGSSVPFNIAKSSSVTTFVFNVSATSARTPASFDVTLANGTCLLTANCNGNVTLHPTSGGGTDLVIPVTYGQSSGGTGGTITADQTSLTLSTASGGSAQTTVQLTTASSSALTFSVTSNAGWLSASPTAGNINSGSAVTLIVTANSTGLVNNQTYSGTLTITPSSGVATQINVSFTVGSTSGGGGTLSPSQTSVAFAYPSGIQSTSVSVTSSNSSVTSYTATPNTQSGWLLVNNNTASVSVGLGSPLTLSVNAGVAAQLSQGQYAGTVTLKDNNGLNVTGQVTITLNVSNSTGSLVVNPTALNLSTPVNGSQQTQNLTITTPTSLQYNIRTYVGSSSNQINWLAISGCQSNSCPRQGGQTVQLIITPTGLGAGTYDGYFEARITSTNEAVQVPVTLVVGTGSSSGTLTLSAGSLAFAAQVNGGAPASQTISVTAGVATAFFISTSVSTPSGGNWLFVSPSGSQTTPVNLSVSINPAGLPVGTFTGNIALSTSSGIQNIPVTLTISTTGGTTSTIAAPTSLAFAYQAGGSSPPQQYVVVSSTGAYTVTPFVTTSTQWLAVSSTSGTGPDRITVSVLPSGLTASTSLYTGSITVSTSDGSITIPVSLLVTSTPVLYSNPGSIYTLTGNDTLSTFITLYASDNSALSPTASSSASWVTLGSPAPGGNTVSYSVSVNRSGLCNGLNTASINVTSNGSNSPTSIPVVARVTGSTASGCGGTTSGALTVDQTSLAFSYQIGSSAPAAKTVSVTSTNTAAQVQFTVAASSTGNWLSATSNSSTTPAALTVTVNPTNLTAAGSPYTGTITLTPTNGTAATTISVTLTVTQPVNVVAASPTSLDFSYRAGDPVPSSKTIQVTGPNGLTFSATANSAGNWLVVSPTSGTTPANVNVSINPANSLTAGSYTGTVVVNGTGTSSGSTTVTVNLTVAPPLPTITKIGNAASYVIGAIAPGEVLYLEGTGLGPATLVQAQLDPNDKTKIATTIGAVQVLVNNIPAPMVYASNTKVSAIVPYEVKGSSTATVYVRYAGQTSNVITFGVTTTAPGVFTANFSGTGPAAAYNQDLSQNFSGNPAARLSTVILFLTGEGETTPAGQTGKITTVSSTGPLTPTPLLRIGVTVDGQPADYTFAGEVPNIVAGVLQLHVTIPQASRTGDVPIVVSIGGNGSQNNVTVSVK